MLFWLFRVIPVDQYPPGAYWLKPTLRVYPHDHSIVWIKINVIGESGTKWKEELVPGSVTQEYGPQLIEFNNFWAVSGLSFICVISFFISYVIPRARKVVTERGTRLSR